MAKRETYLCSNPETAKINRILNFKIPKIRIVIIEKEQTVDRSSKETFS